MDTMMADETRLPADVDAQPVVQAAAALQPVLRDYHDELEREQRLPRALVEEMRTAGFYRLVIPRALGGLEADPLTYLRVVELLAEVESIQQAARKPIRAGVDGGEIYAAAEAVLHKSKLHNHIDFLAHGMGLVSHEAPRLTNAGPVPYDNYDAKRPLDAGMVISVETTLQHPRRGFIKLEDTVAVTANGYEVYGDRARGWNRAGGGA